ncbi:DUF1310 family protein [Bifidobacterium sp. ESL0769]|uniref:DUF1310 family protein n=1 Tax=Bifidobacterium sp. ESL0769 TaxID=2983229 RepID=UPI0023F6F98B|nr:DUF1310 family protein [Bifidobacterium sp. ESL0769]WEV67083.1 DUF1310 family protein [Bifidobacterium sp. ESL0769]
MATADQMPYNGLQPRKRRLPAAVRVVLCVLAVFVAIGGVLVAIPVGYDAYMRHVVHSEEADAVFRRGMRNIDPHAFTKEGIIHSYTIDDDKIEHSPMGGIMVTLYANGDRSLEVMVTLDRPLNEDGSREPLEGQGGGYSRKLYDLVAENERKLAQRPSAMVSSDKRIQLEQPELRNEE